MTSLNQNNAEIPSVISARQSNTNEFSTNFLVKINSSVNGAVVARAPEEVSLRLSSEWDTALGQSTSSNLGILGAEVAGTSIRTQFSSAQVWSGNSPIEITLPLEFYSESSSREEVINPIVKLAKMALPRKGGSINIPGIGEVGVFIPPGPRIFNLQNDANDQITIQFGNFVTFRKVIITEVEPVFVTRDMHSSGFPLRARCEITFRTIFSLTGDAFQEMFNG